MGTTGLKDQTASPPLEGELRLCLERLAIQVSTRPNAVALTHGGVQITYDELDRRSNRLARWCLEQGLNREKRVGVLAERSVETVFTIIGILKAGAAYVPIDPAAPTKRNQLILQDASVKMLLSANDDTEPLVEGTKNLHLGTNRDVTAGYSDGPLSPADRPDKILADQAAYIIYTSGSTGVPKGVVVAHRQMARLFDASAPLFDFSHSDVWTLFHSLAFDFSIWELWGALAHGARLIIVPLSVAQSADAFRALACAEQVSVLNMTPSAFSAFIEADEIAHSDGDPELALRTVIFGGEALDSAPVLDWALNRGACAPKLVNMYGITETTVHATANRLSGELTNQARCIGHALADLEAHVLDERLSPCPPGVIGDLYIGGAGLARGYHERAGLTASRFIAHPCGLPGTRLYRSGDRAEVRLDGTLIFHGRSDAQIKIRGYRIELGEIETVLAMAYNIREAVALPIEAESNVLRIVAFVTLKVPETIDCEALRERCVHQLPDYMVPSRIVALGSLPLTVNGKLDRAALLVLAEEARAAVSQVVYEAPRSEEECVLCEVVAALLDVPRVGLGDHFFSLGGHSLTATRLVIRLRARLGRELPIRTVFAQPQIGALAAALAVAPLSRATLTAVSTRPDPLPASFGQTRLWLLDQLEGPSNRYTIPLAMRLEGVLDVAALQGAIEDLLQRHESLRTLLVEHDGTPAQQILDPAGLKPVLSIETLDESALETRLAVLAAEPFALGEEMPLRAHLFALGEDAHALLLLLHHSAVDGWSLAPLFGDLAATYAIRRAGHVPMLEPLPVQYADYTLWQRAALGEEHEPHSPLATALAYWSKALAGLPEEIPLPADRPRHSSAVPRGGRLRFTLSAALHQRLLALAEQEKATLFMVLQAALAALLRRLGAGDDIPLGAPVAGRADASLEPLVGLFVNTLVLRTRTDGDPAFTVLLGRARAICLDAYAHQELPFERLVEALDPPRVTGRQPLFQSMLVLHNQGTAQLALEGLKVRVLELGAQPAKFDLSFAFSAEQGVDGGLTGTLDYDAERFDTRTARALSRRLLQVLEQAVEAPETVLSRLEVLLPEERAQAGRSAAAWEPRSSSEATLVSLLEHGAELQGKPLELRTRPTNALLPRTIRAKALQPTDEEFLVCRLVAKTLGLSDVGLDDHFFHLGGHSLAAARLVAALRRETNKELPLRVVFQEPVIKDLAEAIRLLAPIMPQASIVPVPGDCFEPFALTAVQEAYWLGRQGLVALGEVACHAYIELGLIDLDADRFTQAWRTVVERHPALRTVIASDATQRVLENVPALELPIEDCRLLSHSETETRVAATAQAMSHQILPTDRWPLFELRLTRLDESRWRLHLSLDALILDGESTALLLEEVFALYHGADLPVPPVLSFRDYVLRLHAPSAEKDAARAYWTERLEHFPPAPELPLAIEPEQLEDPRFSRWQARLEAPLWTALAGRAAAHGLTPSAVLLTAYAEVLAGWTRAEAFTLNLTVGDRRDFHPDVPRLLGVFTTLLPLTIARARSGSFAVRAREQQRQLAADLDQRAFGGVEVQRLLTQRSADPRAGRLPVVFTSLLGERVFSPSAHGVSVETGITQTPQTWLDNKVYACEDGSLGIDWDAPAALFPEGLLTDMIGAYEHLLERLATDEQVWEELDRTLLPAHQRALLATVNDTAGLLPDGLLHEPLLAAAERYPERIAVIEGDRRLSYAALRTRAHALSIRLDGELEVSDQLVAIVMEKGIEQIIAALAVLESGRAFLPISAAQPDLRIATILTQAGARVALTQRRIRRGRDWQATITLLDVPDDEAEGVTTDGAQRTEHRVTPDELAYVIYTSGSSGTPKGVAISHRAARNTLADLAERFRLGPEDRVLWVSSLEFDLSVFDLFGVLGAGGALVVVPPDARKTPHVLAEAVAREGVTLWNSVPAIAELALAAANEPQTQFASLRLIMLSGDWIPLTLPPRLNSVAPRAEIVSLGGATEAAIWSVFHPIREIAPGWRSVPYGRPLRNQALHVLREDLSVCPVHVTGRLFIEGAGLALGYWGDETQSEASFPVHPVSGVRLYDTGDLARYTSDGVLEFLGREDNQVKIRGFRIELGEIESVLINHPDVINAAVSTREHNNGERQLVAFCVIADGTFKLNALRNWCDARLPSYMQPGCYLERHELPLTANGKIDRRRLADLAVNAIPNTSSNQRKPQGPHEITLTALVQSLLGIEDVSVTDNFFRLGGDSISAIRLVTQAVELGLRIEARDVFTYPVIEHLAEWAAAIQHDTVDVENKCEPSRFASDDFCRLFENGFTVRDVWPLTPLQHGLWFLAHCEPEGPDPYTVQIVLNLGQGLDEDRLRLALRALLDRHESLRISFAESPDGGGVQIVHDMIEFPYQRTDLRHLPVAEAECEAAQIERADRSVRFDLTSPPLLRAHFIELNRKISRLILTQHHLLGDGWASSILFRDLFVLYRDRGKTDALPPARGLATYLRWLNSLKRERMLAFWRYYLDSYDSGAALLVPDARRDHLPSQAHVEQPVAHTLSVRIAETSRREGVTPSSLFEAAWAIVLSTLTGCDDVCFGSVGSGREAPVPGIDEMLGLLITTTPVRVRLRPDELIINVIHALQDDRVQRLEHQYLPLTEIQREHGGGALFDTLFTFENYPIQNNPSGKDPNDLPLLGISGTNGNHYPLSLAVLPGEDIRVRLHYSEHAFSQQAVEAVADRLMAVLRQIVDRSQSKIGILYELDPVARQQALGLSPVATTEPTLPTLVDALTCQNPESIAVRADDGIITYGALTTRAQRIAAGLTARGVGAEDVVGLLLPRTGAAIAAMLGVWKCGAAFLPLDLSAPEDRILFVVKDAATKLVLVDTSCAALENIDCATISIDELERDAPPDNLQVPVCSADSLAYVIYTSGSTGRPKGVAVTHRALPLLARAQAQRLELRSNARVLQVASFSFDAAIAEISVALAHGAQLIIAGEQERVGKALSTLIDATNATHITLTPTALTATPPSRLGSLRQIISAGESVTSAALGPWSDVCDIVNAYGPSEASVCVTMSLPWRGAAKLPPIGLPIGVTRPLVLDRHLRLCPPFVTGEIYLDGSGLARGYHGRGGLTASRFVANPYGEPGSRLYRTGDLAERWPDGTLQLRGRADEQIKIRGFRIEPGEVRSVLEVLPLVKQVVVLPHQRPKGERTLVAYLVPSKIDATSPTVPELYELEQGHTSSWLRLEQHFDHSNLNSNDPTFDTRGWNSSYSGCALPDEDMRDYVSRSIDRISMLGPGRVLEIGCGTGLLAFPLIARANGYVGTDISDANILRLQALQCRPNLINRITGLDNARFEAIDARNVGQTLNGVFDTVILCSVIQYFPSARYLSEILRDLAEEALADGGSIFIGDVRSLPLLPAFEASVKLATDGPAAEAVEKSVHQERELALDPAYFYRLSVDLPRVNCVCVVPKRGYRGNELTRYRYDVVIQTHAELLDDHTFAWRSESVTLIALEHHLRQCREAQGWRGLPNSRIVENGIEPESLWSLGEALDFQVDIVLRPWEANGAFDVLFRPRARECVHAPIRWRTLESDSAADTQPVANLPIRDALHRWLTTRARSHCAATLPEYMVPSSIVVLDAFPTTMSGKIDVARLPDLSLIPLSSRYIAATSDEEQCLCRLVASVLGLERIGVADNFFHAGGDSISSIRLINLARDEGLYLTPRDVFLNPIIASLAAVASKEKAAAVADNPIGLFPTPPIMRWLSQRGRSAARFCQGMLLSVPLSVSVKSITAALQVLLDHHDVLRASWHPDDGTLHVPEPGTRILEPCEVLTVRSHDEAFHTLADALAPTEGQNLQAALVRLDGSSDLRLLIALHHIVIDSVSWPIFLADLARVHASCLAGDSVSLPPKTCSYRQWASALPGEVSRRREEFKLWQHMGGSAVQSVFSRPLDRAIDTVVSADSVVTQLPRDVSRALVSVVPKQFGVGVDDVLLAALVVGISAARKMQSDGPLQRFRVMLESHGRLISADSMDLSRTIGWFASLYPFCLDLDEVDVGQVCGDSGKIRRLVRQLHQQRLAIPDYGMGYGLLRYFDEQSAQEFAGHVPPEISFNYMGRFSRPEGGEFTPAPEASAVFGDNDPHLPLDHVLSINAILHDEVDGPCLQLVWYFASGVTSTEEITAIANLFDIAAQRLVAEARTIKIPLLSPHRLPGLSLDLAAIEQFEEQDPDIEDIWPLTSLQQGLAARYGVSDPYYVQTTIEFDEVIDPSRLNEVLNCLVNRHPSLRARLAFTREGTPVQLVHPNMAPDWTEHDLRALPEFAQRERAAALTSIDCKAGMDLKRGPLVRGLLLRLTQGDRLLLGLHHIIADGWSGNLILKDLAVLYSGIDERTLPAPVTPVAYHRWLASSDYAASSRFWQRYLDAFEPNQPIDARGQSRQCERQIPLEVNDRIGAVARAYGVTVGTLLMGAWLLVLGISRGRKDVCVGMVSSGRHVPVPGIERMVGMTVTTVPVRLRLDAEMPLIRTIAALQNELGEMQPHLNFPLADIQREHGAGALFDTLFTYENFPHLSGLERIGEEPIFRVLDGHSATHYPLSLICVPDASLTLRAQYLDSSFNEQEVASLLEWLIRTLSTIAGSPLLPLRDLSFVSKDERQFLIEKVNQTQATYLALTLSELFDRQVRRSPDSTAISDDCKVLTYRDLKSSVDTLACVLRRKGVRPETIVALCFPRSACMIEAILAVLKAGGTYLPLDPDTPSERLSFILNDSAPLLIITERRYADRFDQNVFLLDEFRTPTDSTELFSSDNYQYNSIDNGAHIIYTSGSTGQPKGVYATHRNVVRLVNSKLDGLDIKRQDVWSSVHSFAFDFSVWEIWGALLSGGRLVVVPTNIVQAPARWIELLINEQVTVLSATPGAFANLMQAGADADCLQALPVRLALVGGEAWSPARLPAWPAKIDIRNVYGPTECTIFSTMSGPLTADDREPSLGAFLPNLRGYVLDEYLQPSPCGVEGELYIAGDGVARGYLNNLGLTATRFIANPFGPPGDRLYRTGDRALWRLDRQLTFRGRTDGQIKLRGFRVETEEIEATLVTLPEVNQAAVTLHQWPDGRKSLIGYVVGCRGENNLISAVDDAAFQRALSSRLPAYMIPATFVAMTALPLNRNGKLNRAALQPPADQMTPNGLHAPESPLEITVCRAVEILLHIAVVKLSDSFFTLGGDSLLAARLAARLSAELEIDVSVQSVLEAQTIGALCKRLSKPADDDASLSPLLTLRRGGSATTVVCFYPGTGLSWAYANLLRVLPADFPLYACQANNLQNEVQPPSDFTSLLSNLLEHIERVCPDGPCHLVGWSFGGVVAHLIATTLQSLGREISSLTLIDSYPMPVDARPQYEETDELWRDVALGAGIEVPEQTETLDASLLQRIAREQGHPFGQFTIAVLDAFAINQQHNSQLLPSAPLVRFRGDVLLLTAERATAGQIRAVVSPKDWDPFVTGNVRVVGIDAEHQNMLTRHAVDQMQGLFDYHLSKQMNR